MSNSQPQNPPFKDQLEDAVQSNDFSLVLALIRSNRFSRENHQLLFWDSPLPERWAREIIRLPEYLAILIEYFKQENKTNEQFLRLACSDRPESVIKGVKISRAYSNERHWESLQFFQRHVNQDLKVFYRELKYLRQLQAHWQEQEAFYKGVLQTITFEELLIHTVAYYERVKRDPQTISNNALQTSKEVTLCYVLNEILTIKKLLPTSGNDTYSVEQLQQIIEKELPPKNTAKGIASGAYLPKEKISTTKKLIRETIDFYFQRWVCQYQIDRYLCGYQDFEEMDGMEATFRTNKTFAIQWRNDKKGYWEEIAFFNQADFHNTKSKESFSKRIGIATAKSIENAIFLGLPEKIDLKENSKIDLRRVFELLRTLSLGLSPPGRMVITKEKSAKLHTIVIPNASRDFLKIFTPHFIVALEEEILLNQLHEYLRWGKAEIKQYLRFLSTDLISKDEEKAVDLLTKPLLKVGDNYFWLSSLMKNRRWDNLMHKRIADERIKGLHNEQATNLEALLSKSFRDAKFSSISSWKHSEFNGEIDVLAFQGDTLFVIEVKATPQHEEVLRHAWYQAMRFEHKAFLQLKRAVAFIKDNYAILQQEEKLNLQTRLEDLRIVPLIVSNVFEADDILIHDEYKKVSLFELQVILKNKLYDTLHNRMGSYIPGNIGDLYAAHLLAEKNRKQS